jgi:transposase
MSVSRNSRVREPGHYLTLPGRLSIPTRAYEAEKLKSSGMKVKAIAEKYGVSEASVHKWLMAVREERRNDRANS